MNTQAAENAGNTQESAAKVETYAPEQRASTGGTIYFDDVKIEHEEYKNGENISSHAEATI